MSKQSSKPTGMSQRAAKTLMESQYGPEPIFDGTLLSNSELGKHLTWYNYCVDISDGKKYLSAYLKNANCHEEAKIVENSGDRYFLPTQYWISRIILQGGLVDEGVYARFHENLKESFIKYRNEKIENIKLTKLPAKLNERNVGVMEEIMYAIDNLDKTFDLNEYLSDTDAEDLRDKIINYLLNLLKEAEHFHEDEDTLTYRSYLSNMINGSKPEKAKPTKPRKARARKPIDPVKATKGVSYQLEETELNIKSITPASTWGKSSIWLFDTNSNKITVLRALDENGIQFKGTSVVNFNPETSEAKRIGRRKGEVLTNILQGTKTSLKTILKKLNGVPLPATGRISKFVIILKAEK